MIEKDRFRQAVRKGATEEVAALLAQGGDPNFIVDQMYEKTALHFASEVGFAGICEVLIAGGANVKARTSHGETALHRAAKRGHIDACAVLLKNGADPNARRAHGITPFIDAGSEEAGSPEMCRLFLRHGADINAFDQVGYTLFNTAITLGWMDLADELISAGADTNFTSGTAFHSPLRSAMYSDGWLMPAPSDRCQSRMSYLLKHGADPSYVPPGCPDDYLTPFQLAVKHKRLPLMEFFAARAFVDLDGSTVDGRTLARLCSNDPTTLEMLQSLRVEQALRRGLETLPSAQPEPAPTRSNINMSPI